jgi:hypothetical protein
MDRGSRAQGGSANGVLESATAAAGEDYTAWNARYRLGSWINEE